MRSDMRLAHLAIDQLKDAIATIKRFDYDGATIEECDPSLTIAVTSVRVAISHLNVISQRRDERITESVRKQDERHDSLKGAGFRPIARNAKRAR